MASGLLNLNISAAAGMNAISAAAASAVRGPDQRRASAYTRATHASPMSASGTSIDHVENPKIRPESAITHSEAGGLSTVIRPGASSAPNSQAFHDWVPACTAAA